MAASTIILTLLGYVALLFIVAWRTSRGGSAMGYFTGGRTTHRIVAAVAMVGAAMSGVTYISVPGTVLTEGFSYLQTTLGFFVGYLVIAFVLVPLYYRLGVVSLYEYLERRYGATAHRTGAWFFFLAKIFSASLRAYVICVVLQSLLFDQYNIPFFVNAAIMITLVALYTRRGGVRSVVWVEMFKSLIMVAAIVATIVAIIRELGLDVGGAVELIAQNDYSQTLFFDDPLDGRYFWKQFLAGIFLVVAMTGLDQDMMQTVLSCRSKRDAQQSLLTSIVIQVIVILLFLSLGVLLYMLAAERGIVPTNGQMPLVDSSGVSVVERGDDLFGYVAISGGLPVAVGVLFLLGLVASTYSSAGSALTALTTSFTLDILGVKHDDKSGAIERKRSIAHAVIAICMVLIITTFDAFSSSGAITLIFTMASYTYGPLLGMFLFGLTTRRVPRPWAIPIVAISTPSLCYVIAQNSEAWFAGYSFSYEVLILNGMLTFCGLGLASLGRSIRAERL